MDGGRRRTVALTSLWVCCCACVFARACLCVEGKSVSLFFFFFVSPEMTRVADEDDNDDKGVLWVRVQSVHDIII